ncbi:MAG: N-acetyl-gamma-glutamyl-phosphate reductase [Bacteroidetes bacterium]|nr:N-acetyl-gamma-glutamyl-phosphate reductase [Bacteroidota bacterium]
MSIKAAIVNVTGYAGVELARFLFQHPQVQVTQVTGRSAAGQALADFFPHLAPTDLVIQPEVVEPVDVAFLALPHKASAAQTPDLLKSGAKVIDISADFRLHDRATYEKWYSVEHPCPELLPQAVYGLPEVHRTAIARTRILANPGCYPTSAILGLAPVMDIVQPDIVVDSKSGVSGGGRSLVLTNHYSEVNESVRAYGLGGHRHLPEIQQELEELRARAHPDAPGIALTFVPHLIPMTRGILTTSYARLSREIAPAELRERYQSFYADEPFTAVVGAPPHTKHTYGSNRCLVYPTIDERTGRLIVVSCIDNLVKGAAGQAVQCMNIMFGFDEKAGLPGLPVYP